MNDFVNSPEFNRTTRNIADSGIKIFFKQLGTVVGFLIEFVKEMFRSVFGR